MVDFTIPQVMMTLAALAYTGDERSLWQEVFEGPSNPSAAELSAALSTKDIATDQKWELAWGPAIVASFDNMMFVAQQRDTQTYALVLRGTVGTSMVSWLEDVPTDQKRFDAYTQGQETWVSNGFFDGFTLMQQAPSTGPAQGLTLSAFLEQQARSASAMQVYVTGHSQGAGLMPLFLAWLNAQKDHWDSDVTTAGYGFAPPTAGDAKFAAYIAAHADSNLYVNPNDIVPRGYAEMRTLLTQNIPTKVPAELRLVIDGAADLAGEAASKGGGSWAQAGTVTTFAGHDAVGSYLHQVGCQHSHFTYLAMLGAPLAGDGEAKYTSPNGCAAVYKAVVGGTAN